MDEIFRFGGEIWFHIGNMGRSEWLLVALSVVVFGYYCTRMD